MSGGCQLLFAPLAAEFLQDFGSLLARIRQTDRSADLIRLGFDTYIGHVQHPMRSFVPATRSLINAPPSVPLLEEIARAAVPTVVIWGDQDRLVSRACAEGTAEITNARLIVVKDSGHSWPLQNRDTAKHILVESLADELAPDSLGILLSKAVARHGRVNPRIATQATLEASPLYSRNSLAQALTPLAAFWEKRSTQFRAAGVLESPAHAPPGCRLRPGLRRRRRPRSGSAPDRDRARSSPAPTSVGQSPVPTRDPFPDRGTTAHAGTK